MLGNYFRSLEEALKAVNDHLQSPNRVNLLT